MEILARLKIDYGNRKRQALCLVRATPAPGPDYQFKKTTEGDTESPAQR